MKTIFLLVPILLAGCQNEPTRSDANMCHIAPPASSDVNPKVATEVALNLEKFAKAPISANFKAEVSNAVKETFQKIPDKDVACAMLNQTYVCIKDGSRATDYLTFMKETGVCKQ